MKGDYYLLGTVAAAMLAVPVAALMWAGEPLVIPALGAPNSSSYSSSASSAGGSQPASQPAPSGSGGSQSQSQSQPQSKGSSSSSDGAGGPGEASSTAPPTQPVKVDKTYKSNITSFKILNQSTGVVAVVSLEDYVRGAIAAEVPADYHLEALKAQGVAALSYAIFQANEQRKNPAPALKGADFAADPENRKGYTTEAVVRDFYGEAFDYSWSRLTEASEEVCDLVLVYEEEPIAAAYHAISAGLTESAENVWGGALPYLTTTDSQWDILAAGYKSAAAFTKEEMQELLTGVGATLPVDAAKWLEITERSGAGYVTKVKAGDKELSGDTFRHLLGLRSAYFEMVPSGGNFVFEVKGYGHGVGLSQNGADYLARQGKTFQQILAHYYTGAALARVEKVGH